MTIPQTDSEYLRACAASLRKDGRQDQALRLMKIAEWIDEDEALRDSYREKLRLISDLQRKASRGELSYLGALAGISAVLNTMKDRP